ncbi:MFS transporter [Caulobacter sp. X]|uniref:MFS transporter n=1 Tax=Caulobacter sp. X TaxID=2048901 RepID=UPI000C15DF54|nr:MFS transporter [Caulobacter sp. X]PIB95225.1 MFS transporter [Caulobacter sp. X]
MRPDARSDGESVHPRRWRICALLFCATTINYFDRQLLGVLKPVLDHDIGWSEQDFGNVVFGFQAAYAIGLTSAGWLLDRVGARIGYAVSTLAWSVAIMAHALVSTAGGFMGARFALGLSEAGNYPAAVKTVAEYFPQRQRAFATGLFNAGSNLGAMIAPIFVVIVLARLSWRWAFVIAGVPGLIWLILWLRETGSGKRDSGSAAVAGRGAASRLLLFNRRALAYAVAKFLTDPVWWFYLFWLPDFLHKQHGLQINQFGPPLLTVYILADLGSIVGGWASSKLIDVGWSPNRSRKTTMLVCACLAAPAAIVPRVEGLWPAVLLISLAVAAHQAWSANALTMVSDMFPSRQAASVAGFGGTVGAVGGMIMALVVGRILQETGSFEIVFWGASVAYLAAFIAVQWLAPKFEISGLAKNVDN